MYKIKFSEIDGRGLYATRDIKSGEVIMTCELLVLSEEDTLKVNQTSLEYYTFKLDDKRDCLVLGDAELFNHSDYAQVTYSLEPLDQRQVMVFKATRDIQEGEQLFIDYTLDQNVKVDNYLNSKSLV